jgi:hypothetical protein
VSKQRSAVLTVAILVIIVAAYEFPLLRFHGNAWIWGGPGLGYQIRMRAIPFNHPGKYEFHFRGIPNGDMSLMLYADGKSSADREELTRLDTKIDVLLVDQQGNTICRASATPGTGRVDQIWPLMSAYWGAGFWHSNCLHLPLNRSTSYTLALGISDVDPHSPNVTLIPVLESDQSVWP